MVEEPQVYEFYEGKIVLPLWEDLTARISEVDYEHTGKIETWIEGKIVHQDGPTFPIEFWKDGRLIYKSAPTCPIWSSGTTRHGIAGDLYRKRGITSEKKRDDPDRYTFICWKLDRAFGEFFGWLRSHEELKTKFGGK